MASSPEDSFHFAEVEPLEGALIMSRSSGACVHCKSLKVRCEFGPGENVCQRCKAGNHNCLARDRKKRKPALTHEDLQEKSLKQDRQIEQILLRFDQIRTEKQIRDFVVKAQSDSSPSPSEAAIPQPSAPWLPSSSTSNKIHTQRVDRPKREYREESAELAVSAFFPNDRARGRQLHSFSPPDIVRYCRLYPEEIIELFQLFFDRVNPYFSILDPKLHTPAKLIWNSPFLFTTICAIASRYKRPDIYPLAMNFARAAAGRAVIDDSKSVDICQAYLLLAVYPVPKKKYEKWADDRSWLLMGAAIRMAIELGLNQPPSAPYDEHENLNRTRTWLNCFCADGSHATQFGKLPMLRLDDYLARHSRSWYKTSSLNLSIDIHLCAYVEMIVLMAEFRSAVGGGDLEQRVHEGFDVTPVAIQFDKKLSDLIDLWVGLYAKDSDPKDPICVYRGNTTQMITAYLRLVVLSLGFQYAVKDGISRNSYIVRESIDAARKVINIMTQRLFPSGLLRFSMEAHFLYVAFAAAFLINLLRPKFIVLLDANQTDGIIALVRQLIGVLGSSEVALDDRHTPALYSRFLSSLLARHGVRETTEHGHKGSSGEDIVPQYNDQRQQSPPNIFAWPDTSSVLQGSPEDVSSNSTDSRSGMIWQLSGEADMDFSIQHFVHTISAQDTLSASNVSDFHSAHHMLEEWDVFRGELGGPAGHMRVDSSWLPDEPGTMWTSDLAGLDCTTDSYPN